MIEKNDTKNLRGKTLIVGFPGMALVGKATADFLISKMKLEEYVEFFPVQSPSSVIVMDGIIQPLSIKLYSSSSLQIAVLTASFQPQGEEAQTALAFDLSKKLVDLGFSKIISAAAYVSPEIKNGRKVFVAATNKEFIDELSKVGCVPMNGGISGLNGLIPALAEMYGIEGAVLLGETSEVYVASNVVDYMAVGEILRVLSSYLKFEIDLEDLTSKAKDIDEKIKKAMEKGFQEVAEEKEEQPSTHM
ncbi:PAC2 family protein [Fervidicoccus fontis]|uniref:Proteasome assembly chaperone family protein n=1 Tax=Fervidicoccus fontis (strain DSM 19380 / JCM 18336 / VKM B-2539 / Kam940) TaxID=1163730 RepID=I0A1G7_FERFK|nr:PAC2 family protein [Fervidicoccus fontis]AFH42824.1 hypothetical protein FFONT_0836 [Fervidicoccus fontis Kam940]